MTTSHSRTWTPSWPLVPRVQRFRTTPRVPGIPSGIVDSRQKSRVAAARQDAALLGRDDANLGLLLAPANCRQIQHANGQAHAIDVMVGTNTVLGWQVAQWAATNAAALRVKYVIFAGQIIDFREATPAWHACRDPTSSCALLHGDHVHLSLLD